MFTNADCTVFNKRYNHETRSDIWCKTIIRGIYWEETAGITCEKSTKITNDSALFAAIPDNADTGGKEYVSPKEYKAVSPEAAFTFAPEDIIIKGIIPEYIGGGISVAALQQKYDSIFVITECADLRFGGLSHIEVKGK